jgi:hypothetical protein
MCYCDKMFVNVEKFLKVKYKKILFKINNHNRCQFFEI